MFHIGKNIFSRHKKQKSKEFKEIFEGIMNRTSQIMLPEDRPGEMLRTLKRPLVYYDLIFRRSSTKKILTENELEKFLADAYVHPTEKIMTKNPIQIWNDSYGFIKNNTGVSEEIRNKKCIEYEDIIRRDSFKKLESVNIS
jgi:hypothetical protein